MATPPPRRASQRVREAWYNWKYLDASHVGMFAEMRCPKCRVLVHRPDARDARFTSPCPSCTSRWPLVVARMTPETPGAEQWVRVVHREPDGDRLEWVRMLKGSEELRLLDSLTAFSEITDDAELVERLKKLESTPDPNATHEDLVLQATVANAWQTRELNHSAWVRTARGAGLVDWRPASSYVLDTKAEFPDLDIDPATIVSVRKRPLAEKVAWFREQVRKIRALDLANARGASHEPHQVVVRRECVLEDASTCFMTIKPRELWRACRYMFEDEPTMDSGGVAREFFSLVGSQLFDPALGLFEPVHTADGMVSYRINLNSGIANDLHLQYFRFFGRLVAKALIDGYTVPCHMTKDLYKQMLCEPISVDDIPDPQLKKSVLDVMESDDVDALCLDFTTNVWNLGVTNVVELVPDGANVSVNQFNVERYLHLLLRHVMLDRHVEQLSFFLRGFDEVVPSCIVAVFSANEFEDVIAGLNEPIDVDDWMKHTWYLGAYKKHGADHEVVDWFWKWVRSLDVDGRAKLLQFVTGSARVPVGGFGSLQGDDGTLMSFTVDSVPPSMSIYPRAHTCFNRIELPVYESEEDLRRFCAQVLEGAVTGFSMV